MVPPMANHGDPLTGYRTVRKEESVSDLLIKLDNPLGFIGESRLSHICFRDDWTAVSDLVEIAGKGSKEKDDVIAGLRERLACIKDTMMGPGVTLQEARSLFEEGIAVKHTLYVLKNNVNEEEDIHADTRRWIKFGRKMRK